MLVGLQLNGNQGQQINKDNIRDVTRNQPVRAAVRQPSHQAPQHPQRGPVIDSDDKADDFY